MNKKELHKNKTGFNQREKEILRKAMGAASSKTIDLNKISDNNFDEEYKCERCIHHNPNKFQLNGYGEKLPDFCETGSEYYCCVTGYSLFKERTDI
jgi:hypothetical protein